MKRDEQFASRVEAAVAALEAGTDAEVVVVAAPRSGSYRDVAFAGASVATFFAIVLAFFSPFSFHPVALAIELVGVWAVSAYLLSSPPVLRRLVSAERRAAQVQEAAFAEFHREAVHATPRRIGVLVYISFLEHRVELIPDVGLEAALPGGRWIGVRQQLAVDTLEGFLAGLAALGTLLAEAAPHTEHGAGIALSNAPRIRT